MIKSKNKFLLHFKNISLVILGTFILAFGTEIFYIPFNLVTGGMSGIAITLDQLINPGHQDAELIVSILTWVFFLLGLIFLGKGFALKTLISAITYPIALYLVGLLVTKNAFNGFFVLYVEDANEALKVTYELIACIFGGALTGAGCALTFLGGGSTGGLDIIPLIICKFTKKIKSSTLIFIFDALVVVCAVFVLKNLVLSLLGITSAFLCALVIDKLFLGESKAFVAQIITDKYDEITTAIINNLERTTTIMDCVGGYSREQKKMVMVSFSMVQYNKLIMDVSKIDPKAFITISRAHEINGEGW